VHHKITAAFQRNAQGTLCGFQIENHASETVCAAVSALAINTINALEQLTDEHLICEIPQGETGFIRLDLPNVRLGKVNHDADILMSALWLGLQSIAENYPDDLVIQKCEVEKNA
jgi:uncharacterized protein YsxB (DUF464 family)